MIIMVNSVENCVEMDANIKLVSVMIFMALFVCHCRGDFQVSMDPAGQDYDNDYGQYEIHGISGEDEKTSQFEWPLDRLRALLGVSMHTDNERTLGVEMSAAAPAPAPAQNYGNGNDHNNNNNNNYNMPFHPLGPSVTTPSPPAQSSPPAFNFNAPFPEKEKEKQGSHKGIVISVVLTAAVIFAISGLLLYLYRKFVGHHALEDEQKSERPLLASTISDLSENLKALHASVFGSPNRRTEMGSFGRDKFESFTLPTNMAKTGTAQTRQVQILPLSKKPSSLPPQENSSGEESFHSTCETPSSVPKIPISHPQQESWQSISPPSSPASSSSSSPPSPPLFPLKPSPLPLTASVIPIPSYSITKNRPSRSLCPPPPSRPSSRYPPPQPPLTSRSLPSPRHRTLDIPNSQEGSLPISSTRDDSSLPPLPPRPPPPFCSSSRGAQYPNHSGGKSVEQFNAVRRDGDPLPKLKPLYWDKVRAPPDRAMVWNKLRSGSFELDEEMIESLFGCTTSNTVKIEAAKCSVNPPPKQHQRILDPRKSQNIAILLRALTITREEICDALLEGEGLNTELLEKLMKMEPTREEEARLKGYMGDTSKLGPAEQFIKALLDIPFAFKRIDAMRYRATFEEEVIDIEKSLETLELACKELRCSRLFLKLLEAVLKTGNRMNVGTFRGEAQAFKLDALLKLADIKGIDGKTTLLHFVVQEIIRAEGMRSAETFNNINDKVGPAGSGTSSLGDKEDEHKKLGLQIVSGLSTELYNVKNAAGIDSDVLTSSLSKLSRELVKLGQFQQVEFQRSTRDEEKGNFNKSMTSFLQQAEEKIGQLQKEEERVFFLVKEITEYFHGDSTKEEAHPLRIFVIVRDFLGMLDQVCKEVGRCKKNSSSSSNKGFDMISARYSSYSIFPKTLERKPDSSSDKSISA